MATSSFVASLLLIVVGGGVAVFFPWLQAHWRGVRFQGIIRRELQELRPVPPEFQLNTPWWRHLRKRFVHEEVFAHGRVSENRDFLLSLDPTVVYLVSQLWAAFEKRNASNWLHFLKELADDWRVGSAELRVAYDEWSKLLNEPGQPDEPASNRTDPNGPTDALFRARSSAYATLLPLTRYGSEEKPFEPSAQERAARDAELTDWFYDTGGLLMSAPTLVAFRTARAELRRSEATNAERWRAFSALRTELKIDLGVGHPEERSIELASLPRPHRASL